MSDVKLYDRTECQAMFILGAGTNGNLVVRHENALDDVTCMIDEKILRCSPDFVAICDHYRTANDSCPGCDSEHDDLAALIGHHGTAVSVHIPGGSIDLGTIYQHMDCTWSAMTPTGEVIAVSVPTSDSAVRALTLDHKRRVWHTAVNEAKTRDEAREEQISDAVHLLVKHGIIDFSDHAAVLDTLVHTHLVTTDTHDGSAL